MKFSKPVRDILKGYVNALVDPLNDEIFYVGKALNNNRAFDHLKEGENETAKSQRIAEIRAAEQEPRVEILRYGLDEKSALEVEAAIIDTIGLENLTNEVRGHGIDRGRARIKYLEDRYSSTPISYEDINEKCILFFLNKSYSPTLDEAELYDMTRQFWHNVSKETREGTEYKTALAVVESVVVQAYSIEAWLPAGSTYSSRTFGGKPDKWEFVGRPLNDHHLVGCQLVNPDGTAIQANQKGFSYFPPK